MIPKIDVKIDYRMLAAAGVILAGYFYLAKKALDKAGDTGKEVAVAVGDALNITKDTNLAARATAAIGEAFTGEKGWTIGGAIYDATHEDESAEARHLGGPSGAEGGW